MNLKSIIGFIKNLFLPPTPSVKPLQPARIYPATPVPPEHKQEIASPKPVKIVAISADWFEPVSQQSNDGVPAPKKRQRRKSPSKRSK